MGNTVAHNVAHNLCCCHPWHADAARIIKLLRRARAHNVTFVKQPLSAHPTYSVHITMHFSLSMVLNRLKFLSAHCARIISRIIWLDMARATLQYIMRGLCAPVCYYARHYAQHYARTAHIMREMLILHSALPGCLRRLPYACPTTPPLSTHIMARLSQPMLQTPVVTVKLRRA